MSKYTSNVLLGGNNKLDYHVDDVQKISGAKYKWFLQNKGIPNTIQCECCFEYPGMIQQTSNIKSITDEEYANFCKITITCDKTQIVSDGVDCAIVTVEFPEAGGTATLSIIKPYGDKKTVTTPITASKIITLPKELTSTTEKGTTIIKIHSNKWWTVNGLGTLPIESY